MALDMESLFTFVLSLITVGSALGVVFHKNPVISALFLVGTFAGLGGLYLSLQAPFIAAIQIFIYAGAITVLFIFVIMLLNLQKDPERFKRSKIFTFPRFVVVFILFWIIFSFVQLTAFPVAGPETENILNLSHIAELLFTKFLFPFELGAYLLLIAMIGGVVLAKKRSDAP